MTAPATGTSVPDNSFGPSSRPGGRRRLAGVLVLVLVLVAASAVPAVLAGRRLAGQAIAMDFDAPPEVGECLQAPLPATDRRALAVEIPVTDVVLGPCTGVVGGEVVGWTPRRGSELSDLSMSRQLRGPCLQEAVQYAGLQMSGRRVLAPGAPASDLVRWAPTLGFDAHRLVPGAQEAMAGRTWYACVAVPITHEEYRGSLAGAYAGGTLPPQFGMCWDGTDLDHLPRVLPCAEPHTAELLATAWVFDRSQVAKDGLQSSCEAIAARMMRRADATADGHLAVVLDPISRDGASFGNEPQSVGCFVGAHPPNQVVGTLIGLGEGPVPFAS